MTINKEDRKNRVLEEIVRAHALSAIPIGSKYIAKTLNLSPATIRNVMLELEKEGFVKQPYTSAGRIPTDLGYRRYVDNMDSLSEFECDDMLLKVEKYLNKKRFFEEIIEATSSAISQFTNYTGLALSPNNKLYFDGTYHMLEQPEFRELNMARDFLRLIEEREELVRIMHEDLESQGTAIRIGRETTYDELRECTIITSTYKFKNNISGNVGVIGPMRMCYEEVVPIVEYFAELTTEALEEISG